MVVLPGGGLAMGRYEVTVGEYRAFASAMGVGADGDCALDEGSSWRSPGFGQTDRHPVACVSWDDAEAYLSWLSGRAGAAYRLPSEAEWERVAAGSSPGCYREHGTCLVGSYGSNAAGLSDMVGNLWEWVQRSRGDDGLRWVRGGAWDAWTDEQRHADATDYWHGSRWRDNTIGFRVARALD